MPARFVLQPNRLLARFSSIVDNFTHYNLTKQEAIELARQDMGEKEAIAKVERGIQDEEPWKPGVFGDGTHRWKEALEDIERVHGEAERDEIVRLLTQPSPPERIIPRPSRTAWERLADDEDSPLRRSGR